MNIRKKIDYSAMYVALDTAMAKELSQMELYCAIGKAVSQRSEKGAAVAAAAYLTEHYPDVHGFSPRNVRRMRAFYCAYEDSPEAMKAAMEVGWTQNTVIMEANLTMELREWYLRAEKQFGWSKAELMEKIAVNAHEEIVLTVDEKLCEAEKNYVEFRRTFNRFSTSYNYYLRMNRLVIFRCLLRREGRRRCRRRWRGRNLLMLDPGIEKIKVSDSLYLNSRCGRMFYKKCISIY